MIALRFIFMPSRLLGYLLTSTILNPGLTTTMWFSLSAEGYLGSHDAQSVTAVLNRCSAQGIPDASHQDYYGCMRQCDATSEITPRCGQPTIEHVIRNGATEVLRAWGIGGFLHSCGTRSPGSWIGPSRNFLYMAKHAHKYTITGTTQFGQT
jgi:hypothetical protein